MPPGPSAEMHPGELSVQAQEVACRSLGLDSTKKLYTNTGCWRTGVTVGAPTHRHMFTRRRPVSLMSSERGTAWI